jgi:hypothetical protein
MDTLTQLLIRACKTEVAWVRLRSIYRRYYARGLNYDVETNHIVSLLASVIDEYNPIPTMDLVNNLYRSKLEDVRYPSKAHWDSQCLDALIYTVRTTPKRRLPGLTTPARYK